MAFKLDLSETINKYPVELRVINQQGKQEIHKIFVDFKRFTREGLDAIDPTAEIKKALEAKKIAEQDAVGSEVALDEAPKLNNAEQLNSDVDWALKFVVGWHEVDIHGQTEFNAKNLRELFSAVPNATLDIYIAFIEAHNGGKRKN